MAKTAERLRATSDFEMEASNGLPMFYHEFATAEVEGVGTVRIGIHANLLAAYVMMPGNALGQTNAAPHLFSIPMAALLQGAVDAAIARFLTGEPIMAEPRS